VGFKFQPGQISSSLKIFNLEDRKNFGIRNMKFDQVIDLSICFNKIQESFLVGFRDQAIDLYANAK